MPHVPDLGRKLQLLVDYGPLPDRDALVKAFGVESWNTIRSWSYPSKSADRDNLPKRHEATLRRLLAEALPTSSTEEINFLLDGGALELERALRADDAPSIKAVIEAEAKRGTGRLKLAGRIGLVEHVNTRALPTVKLNEGFALEYQTTKPGFAFLVQHVQQQWAAVRFASGNVTEKRPAGIVLVPGRRGRELVLLHEPATPTEHRFLLFLTLKPYPKEITKPAEAGIVLDWRMLGELARHYVAQPAHARELHLFEIKVSGLPDKQMEEANATPDTNADADG